MSLRTGMYHLLKIERDSPFGFFLSDGEEDVLLHISEADNRNLKVGEDVEAFLYNDHKGRIAATLVKPKLVIGEVDFLEVKDFKAAMGFFLENYISKQVLLPLSELSEDRKIWPIEGDMLLVKLVYDKQERLLAQLVREESDINSYISKQLSEREVLELPASKKIFFEGIVIRHLSMGSHVYLTEYNQIGFLHQTECSKEIRLGEKVNIRVSYIREDNKINLSMRPLKEISMVEDSDRILEVLKERNGAMPYWDKTPPDIILQKFNLSKAAFKRALGKLMKEGIVYQKDGWTHLKNE
ncbi:MAG: S1 RNA-binding domain-containing protein [Vulcanibacillus sp.]